MIVSSSSNEQPLDATHQQGKMTAATFATATRRARTTRTTALSALVVVVGTLYDSIPGCEALVTSNHARHLLTHSNPPVNPVTPPSPFNRQPTALLAAFSDNDDKSTTDVFLPALQAKNKSRLKFGLKALTMEEFMELQAAVQEIHVQQQEKQAAAAAAAAATEAAATNKKKRTGLLDALLPNTCESNFDCPRPTVCCDYGFQKKCCSSGKMVPGQLALVPVVAG